MSKIFNFKQTQVSNNFQFISISALKLKIQEKATKMSFNSFPSFSNEIKFQRLYFNDPTATANFPVSVLQASENLNSATTIDSAPISFYTRFSATYKADTKKQKLKDFIKKLRTKFSIRKNKAKDYLKDKIETYFPVTAEIHEVQPLLLIDIFQSNCSSPTIVKSVASVDCGPEIDIFETECLLPKSSKRLPFRDVSNTNDHLFPQPDKLKNSKDSDKASKKLDLFSDRVPITRRQNVVKSKSKKSK